MPERPRRRRAKAPDRTEHPSPPPPLSPATGGPVLDRQDPGLQLLRDIVRLRVAVERMIAQDQRGGDDIYGEQYNDLCAWALVIFAGHPAVEGRLIRMPDAVTQMNPLLGTERLLARVAFLESAAARILEIDPMSLPEAHGLSERAPGQVINISHSTVQSIAANLQGTQIVAASQGVSERAQELTQLLRQLRSQIEAAGVDNETKYYALKDTEAMQAELEKKRPRLDRVKAIGEGLVQAIGNAGTIAATLSRLLDIASGLHLP